MYKKFVIDPTKQAVALFLYDIILIMFSFKKGIPVARIIGGSDDNKLLRLDTEKTSVNGERTEYGCSRKSRMDERLPIEGRSCVYICGQSGSGKTEKMLSLIKPYSKLFPEKKIFLFSRTNYKDDPAYKKYKISPVQIKIDENLLINPIDITSELNSKDGSIVLFDDCATLQNDKLRGCIDKLVMDILEVGRKLNITTIITSHLIIGNSRATSRVILNECNIWCLFPKSGSLQQAKYALKEHIGLSNDQINELMTLPSRSVSIHKSYPNYIFCDKIAYIL